MVSTQLFSKSNTATEKDRRLSFSSEKTLSSDWQMLSISLALTARAAPFRLWASRKMVSTRLARSSSFELFSSSTSREDMARTCSSASTRNVARSFFSNSSSLVLIRVFRFSASVSRGRAHDQGFTLACRQLIVTHQLFQFLSEFLQVLRRRLRLLGPGNILRGRDLDVLHRRRYLIHAQQLLLAGGGNLSRGLRRFRDAFRQSLHRIPGLGRLFHPGFHRLGALLGSQDRTIGRLLNVA